MSFEVTQKSAEAFRTISEVAVELDLPQHVLRFWETRFPHVHPLKRAGGRRYYRPEDIDLLRGIAKLLYAEGLTIKGVQKILREQGVRYVGGLGRGETDFLTPLKRGAQAPGRDTAVPLPAGREGSGPDATSNVHLFPARVDAEAYAEPGPEPETAQDIARRLTDDQRARLQELLGELLELKARLTAAKANCRTASGPL